jgi:prephenate dehydrogenase
VLFQKISIIGVGLLGGSLGLAIRERKLAARVEGFVRREEAMAECETLAVVDRASNDLASVLADADFVVVCTPVEHMKALLEPVKSSIKPGAVLTDVGSVKVCVVNELESLANSVGAHFIGSHPMAGGEKVGAAESRTDLFQHAVCALTPTAASDFTALNRVNNFWNALGMRVVQLPPQLHDQLVCRASHLPHLVASVLADYVLDPKFPEEQRQLCANGFRDTTRVASGPVEMWRGILSENRGNLSADIDAMIGKLTALKSALSANDSDAIESLLKSGHDRRDAWLTQSEGGE